MENSFTLMPMNQQVDLNPGETYEGYITIVNPADAKADFNYKVSVSPYSVVGEDYTADLQTKNKNNEMVDWIKIEEPTGTIAPNGTKKVKFTITTPLDAAAGGQYASLNVSSNNDDSSNDAFAVKNVFEMASLIYGTVSGDIVKEGEILENNVPGFTAVPPITVSAKLQNKGNIHQSATIILKVTNFFTGDVIFPKDEQQSQFGEMVMPDTIYTTSRQIGSLPSIGVVTVNQTIHFDGKISTTEKQVIICPVWFMIIVVLTVAALITFIVTRIKKARRKKREF